MDLDYAWNVDVFVLHGALLGVNVDCMILLNNMLIKYYIIIKKKTEKLFKDQNNNFIKVKIVNYIYFLVLIK